MIDIEKEREAFEASLWIWNYDFKKHPRSQGYVNEQIELKWQGWLACAEANQLETQRKDEALDFIANYYGGRNEGLAPDFIKCIEKAKQALAPTKETIGYDR